ncbi:SRPBCC family protein [Sphingoaurantiacus capsulatus]|uniref:SRPBCC family protein n=1 Tax=Sphingoaurantiacus capsulatus TaxID=1771310 RepID=A0ABV7XC60_9SPHN
MELKFKVSAHISKPVAEVFEAIVDPATLSRYFTTGGAQGRLATGATVTWDFADFPGAFPVEVIEVVDNQKIVLRWEANEGVPERDAPVVDAGYFTTVEMAFEPLDNDSRTLVTITESGWHETEKGLAASYGNCMGWSQMLAALKVWIEHGINMREQMYK